MNSEEQLKLSSTSKQLRKITSDDSMTEASWAAYNAFRCDLAKVHKTFSCCTQTDFTEEVGTLTDTSLGCKFLGKPVAGLRSRSLPPSSGSIKHSIH